MKKILIHLCNDESYRSFVGALSQQAEQFKIFANSFHGNLFDASHAISPDIAIFPTNEYTQEIHDYISEFNKTKIIVLFANSNIVNESVINFWNSIRIIVIGPNKCFPETKILDTKYIGYDYIYDSDIYRKNPDAIKIDKIAVYLSKNNELNHKLLDGVLYPNSRKKILLFNGVFDSVQNVGFLTPKDNCVIMNTFSSIIDIDDQYVIESIVCGIPNIETNGSILDNIDRCICKPNTIDTENIENLSYYNLIKSQIIPRII